MDTYTIERDPNEIRAWMVIDERGEPVVTGLTWNLAQKRIAALRKTPSLVKATDAAITEINAVFLADPDAIADAQAEGDLYRRRLEGDPDAQPVPVPKPIKVTKVADPVDDVTTPSETRRCSGSPKWGIEPHDTTLDAFGKNAAQKDGLAKTCRSCNERYAEMKRERTAK